MENNNAFILECLKADIERKIGHNLLTPSDFKYLSLQINVTCGEQISSHTIMRVWGYVRTKSKPSVHTLSLLSRFLGFTGITHYALDLNLKKSSGSAYIDTDLLVADMLQPGDTVSLTWDPEREVTLTYLGNMTFKVLAGKNSRLSEGEEFQCVSFAVGSPFVALISKSDRSKNLNYIGGKNGGLTSISLSRDSDDHISRI